MLVLESRTVDSAEVREAVTAFVADRCPWADLTAVRLVVTELLANALHHTGGEWRLRLHARERLLVLELEDTSPVRPRARQPDFGGGGGFGWRLVQQLADRIEVRPGAAGKTVRAEWRAPADRRTEAGARERDGHRPARRGATGSVPRPVDRAGSAAS
ncbi:ATP-binding protein [Streptomyces somaliensis DSM 40738]|uniref:ATP-binding protein n=1 Tax=Streptomyces somaliensis (strain ATCC 33201 / DSM 40738 / JCM 12659 / KCTC 9044 / NCTC 11332 / NRRL B-12077 / IP 733) TaxID=1134445 RepID=A0AA44DF33_STRE0|nr:ATP-binding protein [Streptomyces somaliensis]MCQ0021931.1 ATP-binding protein [Streptomyces somaliensis DSM 40738]NKY15718.1 ATP-binding protein [Streptomyces somaliensis DSM 40738]